MRMLSRLTRAVGALAIVYMAAGTSLAQQSAAPAIAGKWKSTVVPGPGEAPAIEPRLEIRIDAGQALVSLGDKAPQKARLFAIARNSSIVVADFVGLRGDKQTVILRLTRDGRLNVEDFVEGTGARSGNNYYFSEVFERDSR